MHGLRAEAVAALDAAAGDVAFARAALTVAGAPLWVDRAERARAFHVVHPCGMSLVWGPDVAGARGAVVEHLRDRRRAEWLQVEPRWADLDWDGPLGAVPADDAGAAGAAGAPEGGCVRHARVGFAFDPGARPAGGTGVTDGAGDAGTPPGWRARPATAEDFAWPGAVVPAAYWPDARSFLAAGGGVVLERDRAGDADGPGRPVVGAIAFTAFRDGARQEVGIETAPAHRRQGLARAAAAALVAGVVAAGRSPVWSCREGNTGSARLARSLGFVPVSRVPYWHLS